MTQTRHFGGQCAVAIGVALTVLGCGGGDSPGAVDSGSETGIRDTSIDRMTESGAADTQISTDSGAADTTVVTADGSAADSVVADNAVIDTAVLLANGAACATGSGCASGFCVDQVCCQAECNGTCMACAMAKTGRADGVCAAITQGTDPDVECDGTCLTGTCLEGACERRANGTTCRDAAGVCDLAEACADGVCPSDGFRPNTQVCRSAVHGCDVADTCDGASASCPVDAFASGTTYAASCGAYNCSGTAATCRTACAVNADCASGNLCVNGMCSLGRRMFVTSTSYTGNLGGLLGADSICRARASAASLSGYFVAWLSSSTVSAANRIQHYAGPYYRLDGTVPRIIANDWTDLTNGISVAIATDEFGMSSGSSTYAWTGTNGDGTSATTTCNNWTSAAGADTGRSGHTSAGTTAWTSNASNYCNETTYRIYCIETTPPG